MSPVFHIRISISDLSRAFGLRHIRMTRYADSLDDAKRQALSRAGITGEEGRDYLIEGWAI